MTKIIAQNQTKYYIPIKLVYDYMGKAKGWKIPTPGLKDPLKDSIYDDIYIQIITYPIAHPRKSDDLRFKNKTLYDKLSQKVLFTRKGCDSVVQNYSSAQDSEWCNIFGKEKNMLRYKEKNPNNDRYERCVCLAADALAELPHRQKVVMGRLRKYFVPKLFLEKFRHYRFDTLNLEEAPYSIIFPMDINPSFRCDKATTPIEKAICRSKELAELDMKLFKAYHSAIKNKGESIRDAQKKWVIDRDKAYEGKNNEETTAILIKKYRDRLQDLENLN